MVSESSLRIGFPLAVYVLLFGLSAIVCFLSIFQARRISDTDVRNGLIALLVTSGGWAAFHVGYLAAPTPQLQYLFYLAGLIIGIAAVGPWLYFCSAYTGRTLHKQHRLRWSAIGLFLLIVIAKVTNPLHHQYFRTEVVSTPFEYLLVQHQPLHWIVMGLAYSLAFVGVFMLFEMFARVSYDITPLYVIVGLTGLPVLFDVLGATTLYLLDMTYSPIGVAAFAVGVFHIYYDEFQTVRLSGGTEQPVIVLDDDNRIYDTNRPARDLFPALEASTDQPLEDVLPELARLVDEPDPVIELDHADGPRYYSVTANPFSADRSRLGKLITLTDVTEREQYRQDLERKNQRLEEFASIASHDLRNPLNVAQGRLQMAMEECDSEHLDAVARSQDRMGALIDDLLALAREGDQVSETEPVDLAELAQVCWQNVQTKQATIRTETERTVRADASRLQQVFENLFRNAIEHGGEDVTITIGNVADGFYIEDDGSGIPDEERQTVFDAGFSTSEDGTGFGLSIVRQVVTAHGWNIAATEGPDGGARFEITGVEFSEE
jgi:nitrogen-specific signal transduction histidine kinase